MLFKGGEVFAVGGSPGADEQPQTNFQIIHDLVALQMDPQSAVEAPRWSHQPGTPPRDQLPEALRMEEGFDAQILEGLRQKGHKVSVVERWSFGSAKDRERSGKRLLLGGADPRRAHAPRLLRMLAAVAFRKLRDVLPSFRPTPRKWGEPESSFRNGDRQLFGKPKK
jgi:gamma-glutamyltranspeptidase/glutathione hydrolase